MVAIAAHAQHPDNRVQRSIAIQGDTVRLDSLSIAPGSFSLYGTERRIAEDLYQLDLFHALLIPGPHLPHGDYRAHFRTLPLAFGALLRHKDREAFLRPPDAATDPLKYRPERSNSDLLGVSGLNKSGSISRGVLFGNAQDLSVNSSLNLELSGKLSERINVLASVTDNNIPIQAGGHTAELQDFDRVFIKVFDERIALVAGDFVLERPKSHFLTYFKKTKGAGFNTLLGSDDSRVRGELAVSAAISKGKFARFAVNGTEGVQGPYRLNTPDAGFYIIILSGTEKVYVDGMLMTRGLENDYVIDYNTAEVTFTTKRPITKDRRIVVEFQYSDKNYARSLVRLSNELQFGERTILRTDLYTEQDHRNQALQQTLSDTDRLALANAGDDPLGAMVSGADSVDFNADEVRYARIDSLGYAPVYLHTNDADSGQYRVAFTNVGAGMGDYLQQGFTPNGRVFRWMAPDTVSGRIVRKGTHLPVRVLVAPRSQKVLTIGAEHRASKHTRFWAEVGLSDLDKNTFSDRDKHDDQGAAVRAGFAHAFQLSRADTSLRLVLGTDNEWRARNFSVVERYRAVEFERNWNALNVVQDGDQLLSGLTLDLVTAKQGSAGLNSSLFTINDRYQGLRHGLRSDLHPGRFSIVGEASMLDAQAGSTGSNFTRHKAEVRYRLKKFAIGYRDELENNRFRNDSLGGLLAGSYGFHDFEGFVQSADSARSRFRLSAGRRTEEAFHQGMLVPSTVAHTYGGSYELGRGRIRKLGANFNYRQLSIHDSTLTAQKPENTWLARLEHGHGALRGALNWDLFYEFGSGLEQRREFIYLQVPPGQGMYVWRDYNGNGIKELNEFELSPFGYEADHIRSYVQTNAYERTYNNQLSASADLRLSALWNKPEGWRKLVARISDQASYRSDRRTANDDMGYALDPFAMDPDDQGLIANNSSARNTVYYDRSSRKWSIDHTWQSDRTKNLMLNGFESRTRNSQLVHVRWNITTRWMVEAETENGIVANHSDLMSGRSYRIDQSAWKPKLTWQPSTAMRGILQFKHSNKHNGLEGGGETAVLRDLGVEFRWNTAGKGAFQLNANVVDISYDGVVDSSLGMEMLNGLRAGTNVTWTLSLQRRLSNNLQIDLTYNGRRSEGVPMVHVGGAQVRAFF